MFAKLHACPQFTLLPIWFSTSHGELTCRVGQGKESKGGLKKNQKITNLQTFLNCFAMWAVHSQLCVLACGRLFFKPHASKQRHSSQNTPELAQSHSRCMDLHWAVSKLNSSAEFYCKWTGLKPNRKDTMIFLFNRSFEIQLREIIVRHFMCVCFFFFKASLSSSFYHQNESKMCSDTVCIVYWPDTDLDKKINLKIDSFWKLEIMINLTWWIFCQPT